MARDHLEKIKTIRAGVVTQLVKLLLVALASQIVLFLGSAALILIQFPVRVPRKVAMSGASIGSLSSTWETVLEILAPGCLCPSLTWLFVVNQQIMAICGASK